MWNMIIERIPQVGAFVYTAAAFIIPFTVYKLNKKMHQFGDPPWKRDE